MNNNELAPFGRVAPVFRIREPEIRKSAYTSMILGSPRTQRYPKRLPPWPGGLETTGPMPNLIGMYSQDNLICCTTSMVHAPDVLIQSSGTCNGN